MILTHTSCELLRNVRKFRCELAGCAFPLFTLITMLIIVVMAMMMMTMIVLQSSHRTVHLSQRSVLWCIVAQTKLSSNLNTTIGPFSFQTIRPLPLQMISWNMWHNCWCCGSLTRLHLHPFYIIIFSSALCCSCVCAGSGVTSGFSGADDGDRRGNM